MTDVVQVAAGTRHTCALTKLGDVFCWGDNLYGQAGVDPAQQKTVAQPTWVTSGAKRIAASGDFSCASGTTIECWGSNAKGQLGGGSKDPAYRHTPASVRFDSFRAVTDVQTFALGREHGCAAHEGQLLCWGNGMDGQLGLGYLRLELPFAMPISAVTLRGLKIATARAHSCAILAGAAQVACWGSNASGQLGSGTNTATSSFVTAKLPQSGDISDLASGDAHTCALTGGNMVCWGKNDMGQTGGKPSAYDAMPKTVAALDRGQIKAIAAGGDATCALRDDGSVYCFGSNKSGQLGQTPSDTPWPTGFPVKTRGRAIAIAVGSTHACAVIEGGTVQCWGANDAGQLGN
jgi:alpha-tubulin suppressor-like RCC1 family protein